MLPKPTYLYTIFRSKHRKAVFSNNIKINATDIGRVESSKYLGVYIYIDSKLNWSKHIYISLKEKLQMLLVSSAKQERI